MSAAVREGGGVSDSVCLSLCVSEFLYLYARMNEWAR